MRARKRVNLRLGTRMQTGISVTARITVRWCTPFLSLHPRPISSYYSTYKYPLPSCHCPNPINHPVLRFTSEAKEKAPRHTYMETNIEVTDADLAAAYSAVKDEDGGKEDGGKVGVRARVRARLSLGRG